MEDLALDGGELQHATLRRVELVETGGEQRVDRRRNDHLILTLGPGLGEHRDHLLDEQRIPTGRAQDPVAEVAADRTSGQELVDQPLGLRLREGLEPKRHRPPRRGIEQLGTGEAEQQNRRVAREQGDLLDELEEAFLGPLDVFEDDDERAFSGSGAEQLAEGPADLVRRRARRLTPEEAAEGAGRGGVELDPRELLDHLDHWAISDPFAVRQASAPHGGHIAKGREELRGEPRLADARDADDREQAGRALGDDALPLLCQQSPLSLAPDELRVVAARKRRSLRIHRLQPERGEPGRPPLHVQRRRLRDHGVRDEQVRSAGRSGSHRALRPAGGACRSRAARR